MCWVGKRSSPSPHSLNIQIVLQPMQKIPSPGKSKILVLKDMAVSKNGATLAKVFSLAQVFLSFVGGEGTA